jgi:hypothetical protein
MLVGSIARFTFASPIQQLTQANSRTGNNEAGIYWDFC